MKLTILGTGNAMVTECYNTCFVIENNGNSFLVDGGGGSAILKQLKNADVDWKSITDIFVTHKHIDHITGIIWMVRLFTQNMARGSFSGEVNIYGHSEVIEIIRNISFMLLQPGTTKFIDDRLHLISVNDKEERTILGNRVKFFDIHSTKAKQFGFSMYYDNKKLTCCGDEPYCEIEREYAQGSTYLMHEAFCLFSQADVFHPYEKHHSTVKDASILAEELGVENLILYHTEDKNIKDRKNLYIEEGKNYFNGNLYVPDDLDTFEI